jgi:hypothetical protein
LYNALEEEQMAVATLGPDGDEGSRILTLAQIAFGRLRGLLAALDDDLIDRAPSEGEWTVRETLVHAIGVERSYRANTQHALVRRDDEPLTLSADEVRMLQPSQWGPYEVPHRIDVRFRLHRFASHIVEHTVQCEKTIAALGVTLNDPRAIVRSIGATRGAHERRSSRAVLEALDAALLARADAVGA